MVKKFKVMVWKDYRVSETYYKTVEAETEEEAISIAEEAIADEDYDSFLGDQERYDIVISANETNIEEIIDE